MDEPAWKKTKLSLERPYKDDKGDRILDLLDILPDGQSIYEPEKDPSKLSSDKLRRIFIERGVDFFDHPNGKSSLEDASLPPASESTESMPTDEIQESSRSTMTPEELFKMRMEIMPQLFTALGEMTHAREFLSFLLASTAPSQPSPIPSLPSSTLTATIVTKPPPISSVDAFNVQLAIGGKDEALRKAANLFKSAAGSLERGRLRGEKYWVDALKIRRANWGLIPAPLPYGAPTGKGADKTSRDFLISFGLEESPSHFRRRAIGHLATYDHAVDALVFPHCQRTRLRVSLSITDDAGRVSYGSHKPQSASNTPLEESIKAAQQEIIEEEIFSVLIKEASGLPTALARVAERLIVIEAAQGVELRFELVDNDVSDESISSSENEIIVVKCDMIYSILHALLLTMHAGQKSQRIGSTGIQAASNIRPTLLQHVIDMLQYQVFCDRVHAELNKMVNALKDAGIPCTLRFDSIGESGEQLVGLIMAKDASRKLGGEAVLRIDNRYTLRLSFLSPSSLTAHLSQATLSIASIPQLVQLLSDEVERYLLKRICEIGIHACECVNGTWFVDLVSGKTVGRWEGCILNFRVTFGQDFVIHALAYRSGSNQQMSLIETFSSASSTSLTPWLQCLIEKTLSSLNT
ncbi:subunit 17 of mediator complex-domain-containing protein [Hygrophoropsis aurantiaca]|uniref:Subunit 17 of mediator complex-domain-containing protein n=1 Tax=Hygrophoropsis aurantiaca TaxID=72124 RepID=A0ACB8ALL3_9AGAM|nr:subunit 17 of mediator complex-domain-containing protein [Hygrophoropsis aurantiaca]